MKYCLFVSWTNIYTFVYKSKKNIPYGDFHSAGALLSSTSPQNASLISYLQEYMEQKTLLYVS